MSKPYGFWISQYPQLWQFNLLNASELSDYVSKYGLSYVLAGKKIESLWNLGLLRADLILSNRKINRVGIQYIETRSDKKHVYIDVRELKQRKKGWAGALEKKYSIPEGVELLFHPFRYWVLYKLEVYFNLNINPTQFLYTPKSYISLTNHCLRINNQFSKTKDFTGLVNEWNQIASLTVMCEPLGYRHVFNSLKCKSPYFTAERLEQGFDKHKVNIDYFFDVSKLAFYEEIRKELCIAAEIIEPNKDLHILLRLMSSTERLKVKGAIGASMLVLTMAEVLRRTLESILQISLQEEDNLGFGTYMAGGKRSLFGSNRIYDATMIEKKRFIGRLGFDTSVRFRCYVEGETEYGALDSFFNRTGMIEIINLKGNFVERANKGLAFRESLKLDKESSVISIIILDGDNENIVRVLKKCAQDDAMYGQFYISNPDFEKENFNNKELASILWDMAVENGTSLNSKKVLIDGLKDVKSGKELFSKAKEIIPELRIISKGRTWGESLMLYAWKNPEYLPEGSFKKKKRKLVEIVDIILKGLGDTPYANSPEYHMVDAETGKLIDRKNIE